MKNAIIILMLWFSVLSLKAQGNFEDGFRMGYKTGFCFGAEFGSCFAPSAPIPPIPKIGENADNYQDGYNEGFSLAINDRKQETSNNTRYKTTTPQSIDFIYKLGVDNILEIAEAQKHLKGVAFGYYSKSDYNSCISLCLEMLPTDPYDSELYMMIGMSYYAEKDLRKTIYYIKLAREMAIKYEPNNTTYDRPLREFEEEYNKSINKN